MPPAALDGPGDEQSSCNELSGDRSLVKQRSDLLQAGSVALELVEPQRFGEVPRSFVGPARETQDLA